MEKRAGMTMLGKNVQWWVALAGCLSALPATAYEFQIDITTGQQVLAGDGVSPFQGTVLLGYFDAGTDFTQDISLLDTRFNALDVAPAGAQGSRMSQDVPTGGAWPNGSLLWNSGPNQNGDWDATFSGKNMTAVFLDLPVQFDGGTGSVVFDGAAGHLIVDTGNVFQNSVASALFRSAASLEDTDQVLKAGGEARIGVPATPTPTPAPTPTPRPTPPGILSGIDIDGDKRADAVYQNTNSGDLAAWFLDGERLMGSEAFSQSGGGPWRVVAVADMDGDGDPDLVWQNEANGRIAVWIQDGTQFVEGRFFTDAQDNVIQPGGPWVIAAVADIDDDGDNDLVWQKLSDGRIAVWFLANGLQLESSALFTNQPGNADWRVTAAPDLDGDGDTDLFWRNINNGRIAGWEMDGINFLAGIAFPDQGGRAWRIVAVQDMDGDGDLDFVWQRDGDGRAAIWFLNPDFRIATTALLSQQAGAAWQIRNQRPADF